MSVFSTRMAILAQIQRGRSAVEKKNISLNEKGVEFGDAKRLQDNIPRFDFQETMEDDRTLHDWLSTRHRLGITLLCNVSLKVGEAKIILWASWTV